MDDLNSGESISIISDPLFTSRLEADQAGFGFGLSLGVQASRSLSIGIGYERLLADAEARDASGFLECGLDANTVFCSAEYALLHAGGVPIGAGAVLGIAMLDGSLESYVSGQGWGSGASNGTLDGTAPLFEAYAFSDLTLTDRLALHLSVGYRLASVDQVEHNGETVVIADSRKLTVDYSGFTARVSVQVRFGASPPEG